MLKRVGDTPIPDTPETAPQPILNQLPVVLNFDWQVADDPMQWLLQRRKGSRWINRSYCRTREALLRCVNEYCGIVDAEALKRLEMLPDFHA